MLGVNHEYGIIKGEPMHDYQVLHSLVTSTDLWKDFVHFRKLKTDEDLERFEKYLCYMFWLDLCVAEVREITCPTLVCVGCGLFAPCIHSTNINIDTWTANRQKAVRRATAKAYRFILENFPFSNVKAAVICAFGPHFSAFQDVFLDYDASSAIPGTTLHLFCIKLMSVKWHS